MNRFFFVGAFALAVSAATGCSRTTITVLTEPPPGREASLDVESGELRVSRGLAVVLECTEYDDTYSGPCRELDVDLSGDDVASTFDVNLDAFGSSVGNVDGDTGLAAPAQRKGVLVAATAAGETEITLTASDAPVTLTLTVLDPDA